MGFGVGFFFPPTEKLRKSFSGFYIEKFKGKKASSLMPELNSNHCSALLEFGSIPVLLPFGRSCGNTGAFS